MALEDDSGRVTASSPDLASLDGRINALEARVGQDHTQRILSLEARFSDLENRVATLSQTYGQLLAFVNELDQSIEDPPPDPDKSHQSGAVQSSFANHITNLSPEIAQNGSTLSIHVPPSQAHPNSSHQVMTLNLSLGSGSEGGEFKHTIFFLPRPSDPKTSSCIPISVEKCQARGKTNKTCRSFKFFINMPHERRSA